MKAPEPPMAPKMAKAWARSRGSRKVTVSVAKAAGAKRAPKTPCAARALTSSPKLRAAPPRSEATANPTRPTIKELRRPQRSLRRPPRNMSDPKART